RHHYKLDPAVVVSRGGKADRKHESCTFMNAQPGPQGPANDPPINVYISLYKGTVKGNRNDHRLIVRFKYTSTVAAASKGDDKRGTFDCCDSEPDDDVLEEEDDPGDGSPPPPDQP